MKPINKAKIAASRDDTESASESNPSVLWRPPSPLGLHTQVKAKVATKSGTVEI